MSAIAVAPHIDPLARLPGEITQVSVDTYAWFTQDSRAAFVGVGVAIAVYMAFWGLRWGLVRTLGKTRDVATWRGFISRIVQKTRSFFIAAVAADAVTHVVAPPGPLVRAIDVGLTIAFAIQGAVWVREIILSLVERRASAEDHAALASATNIIRVLVNVIVWALAIILILDNIGVNVTALVAGLGVGGIAIGFAAQGIFGDLFAALAILFDRPFRVGDAISFGTVQGNVEAIGLKTVRIRALAGEQIIVSNAKLLEQQIANNRRIVERRVVLNIGVIYQTTPDQLEAIPGEIERIIAARDKCRFDRVYFINFGASSLDFEVVFHVIEPELTTMLAERQAIGFAILRRFSEMEIDFAYPSQTTFAAGPDGRAIDPRQPLPVAEPAAEKLSPSE